MSKIHQPGMAGAVTLEGTQQGHRAVERNSTRDREFPLFANPESAPKGAETREGRRERHRRETFERLVAASREILFSRELDQVTVQDITEGRRCRERHLLQLLPLKRARGFQVAG